MDQNPQACMIFNDRSSTLRAPLTVLRHLRSQSSLYWVESGLSLTAMGQQLSPAPTLRMGPRWLLHPAAEMLRPYHSSVWPEHVSRSEEALVYTSQPEALGCVVWPPPEMVTFLHSRLGSCKLRTGP